MDVMIDLETLGTSPQAPIVSIGVVTFDLDALWQTQNPLLAHSAAKRMLNTL
jgi:DNA polymerase III epsilon subunit-like protein